MLWLEAGIRTRSQPVFSRGDGAQLLVLSHQAQVAMRLPPTNSPRPAEHIDIFTAPVRQRVARHLLDLATSRLDASCTLTASVNQQDLARRRVEILDPLCMSQELWSRGRDESQSA
jgi:hypothetical protein